MGKGQEKKRGRPRTVWTPKALKDAAEYYFSRCDSRTKVVMTKKGPLEVENPAPYSIEGLCNHLGITTVTFRNWKADGGALGEMAQMLHQRVAENRITGALDGSQNASFAQFMLKNNNADEYRDKVEVEGAVNDSLRSIFECIAGKANQKPC